jgi:hypothetical protein
MKKSRKKYMTLCYYCCENSETTFTHLVTLILIPDKNCISPLITCKSITLISLFYGREALLIKKFSGNLKAKV